jgi:STE24 endopeptidase
MNSYLAVILAALLLRYGLELLSEWLNLRHVQEELPAPFQGWYDAEKYRTSQRYLREKTGFGIVADTVQTASLVAFILAGGFRWLDHLARSFGFGVVPTGLVFGAALMLAGWLLEIPFGAYRAFRIEQRYGFNRMTARTFALDQLKGLLITAVIGGLIFGGIIWFFARAGGFAWLFAWGALVLFEVVLVFLAPYVIMPLFNKFTPLAQGALRQAIEAYAQAQALHMKGVFTMDGSKRSSKTNAFFTGLGRSRRIVLYDTLIEKHPPREIVAVVAHELGHSRLGHIPRALIRGILVSGATFYLLSLFMGNAALTAAFKVEQPSIYTGLVFFGLLYTPLAMITALFESAISRRHEFAADRFAARTTGDASAMIEALKRLSVDNLADLTPHPFNVWLGDSHPPVLARIQALSEADGNAA